MDIDKRFISYKPSSGERIYKYFIGYLDDDDDDDDDDKIELIHVMLPKKRAYMKSYKGETKWIYFSIEDDELLKNYYNIWIDVSNTIKNNLIINLSLIKFLKTKIKFYGVEAIYFREK